MRFRVLLTTVFTVLLALVAGLTTASLEFNSVVQAAPAFASTSEPNTSTAYAYDVCAICTSPAGGRWEQAAYRYDGATYLLGEKMDSMPGGPAADATEGLASEGSGFFRGARPGEQPDFTLKPGEYRMTGTGQVRGLSVFNNAEALTARGFDPYEIDQASITDALSIEQRGANAEQFETVPSNGGYPPEEEFQSALYELRVLSQ